MAQARRDLEHARGDLAGAYYEWAAFSCQQAAEKAVQAVFQRRGAEVRGHSVADMLGVLARTDAVPDRLRQAALELDKAYIPPRYPNAHASGFPGEKYTRPEAERLIDHANRVLRFCEGLLA